MKFLLLLLLLGCAKEPDKEPVPMVTEGQRARLLALKSAILDWAPTCGDGWLCEEGSDGDTMLWAGLSGQCGTVFASQGPDGRLYRNPGRVGETQTNSFSRDMLYGYLVCALKERNTTSLESFTSYVLSNDYLLCDDATDNRCDFGYVKYRVIWAVLGRIYTELGLEPTWQMTQAAYGDDSTLLSQARLTPLGFTLHLTSLPVYLDKLLGYESNFLRSTRNVIVSRQPANPWFRWLRDGSTAAVAKSVLDKCPTEKPDRAHQWSWQREDAERAWEHSMGWDCVFMVNRLLE